MTETVKGITTSDTTSITILEIIERTDRAYVIFPDIPEWKAWVLSGGLQAFADTHNVEIDFLLYRMPQELEEAYRAVLAGVKGLGEAVHERRAVVADAATRAGFQAIAWIDGWDEMGSSSDEEEVDAP